MGQEQSTALDYPALDLTSSQFRLLRVRPANSIYDVVECDFVVGVHAFNILAIG